MNVSLFPDILGAGRLGTRVAEEKLEAVIAEAEYLSS